MQKLYPDSFAGKCILAILLLIGAGYLLERLIVTDHEAIAYSIEEMMEGVKQQEADRVLDQVDSRLSITAAGRLLSARLEEGQTELEKEQLRSLLEQFFQRFRVKLLFQQSLEIEIREETATARLTTVGRIQQKQEKAPSDSSRRFSASWRLSFDRKAEGWRLVGIGRAQ